MKDGARCANIVEWSDEDDCFVGSCPGLFYGGCHGDDEKAVFAELSDRRRNDRALEKGWQAAATNSQRRRLR
jgi:hypothetical protein